jgi:hypothetical protein
MKDENHFVSKKWGELMFIPTKTNSVKNTCRHCLLRHSEDECQQAPCASYQREDGREGYFSIHQMP